jgi:hypothetical protein
MTTDIAKALVKLPSWKWMVGMVTTGTLYPGVVVSIREDLVTVHEKGLLRLLQPDELPDITHPATIGCVLPIIAEVDEPFLPHPLIDAAPALYQALINMSGFK